MAVSMSGTKSSRLSSGWAFLNSVMRPKVSGRPSNSARNERSLGDSLSLSPMKSSNFSPEKKPRQGHGCSRTFHPIPQRLLAKWMSRRQTMPMTASHVKRTNKRSLWRNSHPISKVRRRRPPGANLPLARRRTQFVGPGPTATTIVCLCGPRPPPRIVRIGGHAVQSRPANERNRR